VTTFDVISTRKVISHPLYGRDEKSMEKVNLHIIISPGATRRKKKENNFEQFFMYFEEKQ
jgi:hypothetical protein